MLLEDINNNYLGIHFHEVIICLWLFGANWYLTPPPPPRDDAVPVLLKTFLFLHKVFDLFIIYSKVHEFKFFCFPSLLNPLFWRSTTIYFYKIYFNSSSPWPIYEWSMVSFHDLKLNRKWDTPYPFRGCWVRGTKRSYIKQKYSQNCRVFKVPRISQSERAILLGCRGWML